jgi:4-hydroxy-3-methylbut-2-en-1-yl diphosphate reductase
MSARNELLLLAPMRIEGRALRRGAATADVVVTGIGPRRSMAAGDRFAAVLAAHRAIAVAGVCGATDPRLVPGDVVVATSVVDPDGREHEVPGAGMLAAELTRAGLRAVAGPLRSCTGLVRGAERAAFAARGALAVDMESAWLLDAIPDGVPRAVVRAVVDAPGHELASLRTAAHARLAFRSLRAVVPVLERWAAGIRPRQVLLASPRGFCAGVERAIEVVERALDRFGPPVYVRRHIIHNTHVVADLAARGAVFVEELDEVPHGSRVVFAAHGIAPAVRDEARRRGLDSIDATCPLVAKVHTEVRRFAAKDYRVLLIGHPDHEEVQGTTGEAPDAIAVIEDVAAADEATVESPERVAYVTQTTLATDEVAEIIARLRSRFPTIEGPARDDICYATQNRQDAARALAAECDVVLVVGSPDSSNSNRLVEVVRREGRPAHLVDDDAGLEIAWVADAARVGITAGASAPEELVQRVVSALGALGPVDVAERTLLTEDVHFTLPAEVR